MPTPSPNVADLAASTKRIAEEREIARAKARERACGPIIVLLREQGMLGGGPNQPDVRYGKITVYFDGDRATDLLVETSLLNRHHLKAFEEKGG